MRNSEQAGDGQARSRFELIDFPDSKLYSPIEAALPDRAAMPLRSLKMNPIENPLCLAALSMVAALSGQIIYALIRRDLACLRGFHYWIDDPSIRRMTSERGMRRISELCLPGVWMLLGGVPQALAVSLSFTTLIVGLRGSWWCLIVLPLVYVGAEAVSSYGLRHFARRRLKSITRKQSANKPLHPTAGNAPV